MIETIVLQAGDTVIRVPNEVVEALLRVARDRISGQVVLHCRAGEIVEVVMADHRPVRSSRGTAA